MPSAAMSLSAIFLASAIAEGIIAQEEDSTFEFVAVSVCVATEAETALPTDTLLSTVSSVLCAFFGSSFAGLDSHATQSMHMHSHT